MERSDRGLLFGWPGAMAKTPSPLIGHQEGRPCPVKGMLALGSLVCFSCLFSLRVLESFPFLPLSFLSVIDDFVRGDFWLAFA